MTHSTISRPMAYTALAALVATVSLPILARSSTTREVVWDDDIGDVTSRSNFKIPDVSEVRVRQVKNHLEIRVTLAGDVEDILRQQNHNGRHVGFEFVHLYIDTDNDTATGERIRAPDKRAGYDVEVAVVTGMATKFGKKLYWKWGLAATADPTKVDRFAANYFVRKGGFKLVTIRRGRSEPKKGASIDGDTVRVLVPLEDLGIKKGTTLKLCFKDVYAKMMEADFAPILETSDERLLGVR